jgi:hypothetical protein
MFSQPICTPLSIPQSVDSLKRIASCRSIQALVAPSRRSTPVDNVLAGECHNVSGVKRSEAPTRARVIRRLEEMSIMKEDGWMEGSGRIRDRDEASKTGSLGSGRILIKGRVEGK